MNRSKARRIRQLYLDGTTVNLICHQMDLTPSVVYSVIRNQTWFDPAYHPPKRPRQVLEEIGLVEINRQRSEGRSWETISEQILKDTGDFVSGDRIRDWSLNQESSRRIYGRFQ